MLAFVMRRALTATALSFLASCREAPPPPAPMTPPAALPHPAPTDGSARAPSDVFRPQRVTHAGRAMGTHVQLVAYTTPSVDATQAARLFEAALVEIQRVESLMTTWRADSELSRVNASAGKAPVSVSDETFAVVAKSLETSRISEGTFDITFESLHGLWKFDEDLDPSPPGAADVKKRLPLVGYGHVHVDTSKKSIFLDRAGTKISLGGIAKGYGVDRAADVLSRGGLESFFVQAGGDLLARGQKPDGTGWQAGIRDPRGPATKYFAMVEVSDHAFSTAGDYERSYIVDGKRYHHIIDPRTGFPATASRSVTIWAKTAFEADAIDDAVFILGPKKGLALVDSLDDVGAVIVDDKNDLWVSKRLRGKVALVAAPSDGP